MASLELLSALAGGTGAFAEHRQREAELAEFLRQEMAKLELRRQIEEIRQGAQTGREELRQTRQDERQKTKIEADREREDRKAKRERRGEGRARRRSATEGLVEALARGSVMGVEAPGEVPRKPLEMNALAAAIMQQVKEVEKDRASQRIEGRPLKTRPPKRERPRRPAFPTLDQFKREVAAELDRNSGGIARSREEAIRIVVEAEGRVFLHLF